MKICITAQGKTKDSLIDVRFGRCPFFVFLDKKGTIKKVIENPGVVAARGAGIAAAQAVINEGADIIITGNMGPNAFFVLSQSGVKIFLAPPLTTIEKAFSLWREDKLNQLLEAPIGGRRGFGRRGLRFGPP